jgi:glycosyltransferase involved in cell wall biosynthesis
VSPRTADRHAIHMVEVGGRGGVYQHAVAVVEGLAGTGRRVVLHTAGDAELLPAAPVEVCGCIEWARELDPRLRRPYIAARYILRTVPHLRLAVRPGDVYHFQGEFKPALTTLGLAVQRAGRRRRVVHSRHNTFSRAGRRTDDLLMRADARLADAVVVFSARDAERVAAWGARPVVSPLVQYAPPVEQDAVERWRRHWGAGGGTRAILFAGQVRRDKRLDLAIAASARVGDPHVLAVVGEDKGDAERCRRIADELEVEVSWTVRYVTLEEFSACLAAADVVVCPYDRASQSGVLALARELGTPTVATDVGGLSELASVRVPPDDPAALAAGIEEAMALAGRADDLAPAALAAHLRAYGEAEG